MKQDIEITQAAAPVLATEIASSIPAALEGKSLTALGLSEGDLPAIQEIASRIDPTQPLSVAEFGRDVAEHTSRYADELLDQVRNKDLEEAGQKLGQVVSIAQGINMNALTDRRSKVWVIGPLIDKVRLKVQNVIGEFETTKEQIDRLVDEVGLTQKGLALRNVTLEQMFGAVKEEHKMLGLHIAAGKVRLGELQAMASELRSKAQTPTEVQALADLDAVIANLDIRVGNLMTMQQSALQTLPQIRIIQTNNQVLVDKFHTIREVTVPAWKRQFVLALGLNEQRNAVELATTIDNTTQEFLKRNAKLTHKNSVETAKANQRLVIDVDTLKEVQDTLIQTVADVIKIQQAGVIERRKAEVQIERMRDDLQAKLARPGRKEAA